MNHQKNLEREIAMTQSTLTEALEALAILEQTDAKLTSTTRTPLHIMDLKEKRERVENLKQKLTALEAQLEALAVSTPTSKPTEPPSPPLEALAVSTPTSKPTEPPSPPL